VSELDPDYSPDAGTGLLSPISYNRCYAEFYVRKIPRIRIGGPALQRGVVFKWFYSLSRRITFVGGTCALLSALLVSQSINQSINQSTNQSINQSINENRIKVTKVTNVTARPLIPC